MGHQKITAYKIYKYFGLFLSGILFLFSFARFHIQFQEFEDLDENFTCLFSSNPSSAEGLAKECQAQGIDCETLKISQEPSLQATELPRTAFGYVVQLDGSRLKELYLNASAPSCMASTRLAIALFGSEKVRGKHIFYQGTSYLIKHVVPCEMPILFLGQRTHLQTMETEYDISISIVRGMKALNYHKTEHFFQNNDARIDVGLLKWLVYLIVFFFFLDILILFFMHFKKCHAAGWIYLFFLLLWLCYWKLEIFSHMADFPAWILPGKWSDLEGFRTLWENLSTQLSVISRFRDYPILCRYYQGLTGCLVDLVLCFLSIWVFLKNTL